jgi:uncharacterized lipoprotein YajG
VSKSINSRICITIIQLLVTAFLLSGCASNYSSEGGFTLNCHPPHDVEPIPSLHHNVRVVSLDGRADYEKDMAQAAKPTKGQEALGILAFGAIYPLFPDVEQSQTFEFVDAFRKALSERLTREGFNIMNSETDDVDTLEMTVSKIMLSFQSGNWHGAINYCANAYRNGTVIYSQQISEYSKKYNLWGTGSGQDAIDEAFTQAIMRFDVDAFTKAVSGAAMQGRTE